MLNESSFTGIKPLDTVYEPISWIHFGGCRGDRLPQITGLRCLFKSALYGLEFIYNGEVYNGAMVVDSMREHDQFGSIRDRNSEEPVTIFTIDGAGGERVCSLTVGINRYSRHGALRYYSVRIIALLPVIPFNCMLTTIGVQITTNRGRTVHLGKKRNNMEIRELAVASNTTMTGLYGNYVCL